MIEVFKPSNRRSILRRGFATMAGVFGLAVVEKEARSAPVTTTPAIKSNPNERRFYARRCCGKTGIQRGGGIGQTTRLVSNGELFAQIGGAPIGTMTCSNFRMESAFGVSSETASDLEFETLRLPEGTLFSMAAGGPEKAYAVVGGTGAFAGARGMYRIEERQELESSGLVEIVVTLNS